MTSETTSKTDFFPSFSYARSLFVRLFRRVTPLILQMGEGSFAL